MPGEARPKLPQTVRRKLIAEKRMSAPLTKAQLARFDRARQALLERRSDGDELIPF